MSKFVLRTSGGKRDVLVAAESLCRGPQLVTARFAGPANRGWRLYPEVTAKCDKKKGKGRRH